MQGESKFNRKLLVIARASHSLKGQDVMFQNLDGPYIDEVSAFFSEATVVSTRVRYSPESNHTYIFKNKVNYLSPMRRKKHFFKSVKQLRNQVKNHDVIFVFMPVLLSVIAKYFAKKYKKKSKRGNE